MSLVTFLSIARTALLTQQRAMDVTANNVANAQTPGYRRQRLALTEAMPLQMPFGTVGRGVVMLGVQRAVDMFHDASYRQDNGLFGRAATMANVFSQIEASLDEPSDNGLSSTLDGLFSAFSDLSNNPSSSANREEVRRVAQRLVDRLHTLDADVARAQSNSADSMRAQVNDVNALIARIADLNTKVLSEGGPAHQAADLQDQRDQLVDQLSGLVGIRVGQNGDGTISVMSGTSVLVDRGVARALDVRSGSGGTLAIGVIGDSSTLDPGAGSIKGLLEMANVQLPAIRAKLDALAGSLVASINAIHRTGFNAAGATGVDFFDPAGVSAGSIALSAPVAASGDAIAAGGTAASGDGSIAALLAALGGTALAALGGRSPRDYLIDIASGVGNATRDAASDTDTYQALTDRADAMRQSVTGVNLDEEMVALIGQQQAYGAAARLIAIADELMRDLLNTLG